MNNVWRCCIFKRLVLNVNNNDKKFAYLHAKRNMTRIRCKDSCKCSVTCIKFVTSIFMNKCQRKAAPVHTMKTCRGIVGTAPHICNLNVKLRWVVSFMRKAALPQRKRPQLAEWVPEPVLTHWRRGKSLANATNQPSDHPAHSPVPIPSNISQSPRLSWI